jgi:hypothetical protein
LFSLGADAAVHVIDLIAKFVLITFACAFIAGVFAGMAVIGYAVCRDFLVRDEYDSLFSVGPHGRNALAFLKQWFRRLILLWVGAFVTGITWILIHILFASSR